MSTPQEKSLKSSIPKESGPTPIHYFKKNVYGNELNYIHHPDVAKAHHRLTGQTTLGEHHIEAYQSLGHEVKHIPKN